MLQELLGPTGDATKTFFDTLTDIFGGEQKFARLLSTHKESNVNREEAEKL